MTNVLFVKSQNIEPLYPKGKKFTLGLYAVYKDFNQIDKIVKETRDELKKILKNVENPDKIIPIPFIPKNQSGKIIDNSHLY